jgi:hypothetical protein
MPARNPVRLRTARACAVIGMTFSPEQIASLFNDLGLPFVRGGDDFLVTPPTWRFDIEIEEDLIEEIARLHGYDNIPAPAPRGNLKMMMQPEAQRPAPAFASCWSTAAIRKSSISPLSRRGGRLIFQPIPIQYALPIRLPAKWE